MTSAHDFYARLGLPAGIGQSAKVVQRVALHILSEYDLGPAQRAAIRQAQGTLSKPADRKKWEQFDWKLYRTKPLGNDCWHINGREVLPKCDDGVPVAEGTHDVTDARAAGAPCISKHSQKRQLLFAFAQEQR